MYYMLSFLQQIEIATQNGGEAERLKADSYPFSKEIESFQIDSSSTCAHIPDSRMLNQSVTYLIIMDTREEYMKILDYLLVQCKFGTKNSCNEALETAEFKLMNDWHSNQQQID
uniref:Uncharacterized protein n=1 Tax=Onchocerca volvulus TaxID=6282 RepID=A0A8R1XYI0_ONCVO